MALSYNYEQRSWIVKDPPGKPEGSFTYLPYWLIMEQSLCKLQQRQLFYLYIK